MAVLFLKEFNWVQQAFVLHGAKSMIRKLLCAHTATEMIPTALLGLVSHTACCWSPCSILL